jgi:hypothetical protein
MKLGDVVVACVLTMADGVAARENGGVRAQVLGQLERSQMRSRRPEGSRCSAGVST